MTITIELPDEIAAELKRDAERQGVTVEEVVAGLKTLFIEWLEKTMREEAEAAEQEDKYGTEALINEAVRQMYENQVRNRELAVVAITQKNNLLAETAKLERMVVDSEKRAAQALKAGNKELAKTFFQEKQQYEELLFQMRKNLLIATEETEKIKAAIKNEEAKIRKTTSDALASKSTLQQTEMLSKIYDAVDAMDIYPGADVTKEEQDRAFSAWAELQHEPRTAEDKLEQSLMTEMQDLRTRMAKLEHEWLRYDIWKRQQKADKAAS